MDVEEQASNLQMSDKGATTDASLNEKSKRKRKRKAVSDLRFLNEVATPSKKKDRKKEYVFICLLIIYWDLFAIRYIYDNINAHKKKRKTLFKM